MAWEQRSGVHYGWAIVGSPGGEWEPRFWRNQEYERQCSNQCSGTGSNRKAGAEANNDNNAVEHTSTGQPTEYLDDTRTWIVKWENLATADGLSVFSTSATKFRTFPAGLFPDSRRSTKLFPELYTVFTPICAKFESTGNEQRRWWRAR